MSAKTTKAERTRLAIVEAALALFAERGYAETTMRLVAERAGVSTGNAYYYFKSKDHLVHGFYERSHVEHLELCEPLLADEPDFKRRLRGVLRAKIDSVERFHAFAGALFKTAADPKSPLNPFSEESRPVRDQAIDLLRRVVEGSRLRVPRDLQAELPDLLWMYEMSIILFWIHDDSPQHERTYKLIDHTVDIVGQLTSLAGNRLLAPLRKRALRLVTDLKETVS